MKKFLAAVTAVLLFVGIILTSASFGLFAETETENGTDGSQNGNDVAEEVTKTASEMKISQEGLDLIKNFEGYARYPYEDYSHWSIGYGSYVCSLDEDPYEIYPNGISIIEAEAMLLSTVGKYIAAVNKFAVSNNIVLTQNQFDALCSFTYNIGANVWKKDPSDFRIKALLLSGDYTPEEMKDAFYLWRHAGGKENSGLAKRRLREAALFNSDINMANPEENGYDVKYYITNVTYLKIATEPTADSSSLGSLRRNNVIPVLYTDESGEYGFTTYAAYFGWVRMKDLIGIDEKGSVTVLDESCRDEQGITYTLDHVNMYACVGDGSDGANNSGYEGANNKYVYLTRYIIFDDRVYTLTSLGVKAFSECQHIDRIYIPDSVTEISEDTFEGSALTVIYYDGGSYAEEYAKSSIYTATNYKCISAHTFGEWVTVNEGDLEGARVQEKTCSVCKDTVTRTAVSIAVTVFPEKTEFYEGDEFSSSGIRVLAYYDDGESYEITDLVTFEGFDSNVLGNTRVSVRYSVFETGYTVRIIEKVLVGISVMKTPKVTSFVEGTAVDYSGLEVVAMYDNGSREVISEYELSECDINTVGKQTVTVTYNGFKAAFSVTVKAKSVTAVSIISNPYKMEYYCGEEFDPEGIEMKVSYDNGTTEIVDSGFTVKRYDSTEPGRIKVRVYYQGLYKNIYVTIILNRLVSESYGIDGDDACLIDPSTTVEQLLAQFEDSERIIVKSVLGRTLGNNDYVGSGSTLELWYNADKLDTLTVSVTGDLNGDGVMSYGDYLLMSSYFTNPQSVRSFNASYDVNKDEEITLSDLVCMLSQIKTKYEDE